MYLLLLLIIMYIFDSFIIIMRLLFVHLKILINHFLPLVFATLCFSKQIWSCTTKTFFYTYAYVCIYVFFVSLSYTKHLLAICTTLVYDQQKFQSANATRVVL